MGMLLRRHNIPLGSIKQGGKHSPVFVVENKVKSEPTTKINQYTKTDINRMSTSELRELALEHDIEGAGKNTGSELKKILIDKLV